jgi:hypothetical protein
VVSFGSALCAGSCVQAPTPDIDSGERTEDAQVDGSVGEAAEDVRLFTIVRCTEEQRGADCKEICANAGISCPPWRLHPKKEDGGKGDLGECRSVALARSCWYYYPNGDVCVFFSGGFSWCRYAGGR